MTDKRLFPKIYPFSVEFELGDSIMRRLDSALFYMRREYGRLHEGHTPTFIISLSARGYVDLMEDERKNGTQKFSRWDAHSKTLIGYPYVIRREQTELFKIIER